MLYLSLLPGPRCKFTTGRQNQDRSRLSTNHRRRWQDRSRPVLHCNAPQVTRRIVQIIIKTALTMLIFMSDSSGCCHESKMETQQLSPYSTMRSREQETFDQYNSGYIWICKAEIHEDLEKRKRKEECLYSAILADTPLTKRSDMDHIVLPANCTMPAFPS